MDLLLNAQMLCRPSTRRPRMEAVDKANCAPKLKVDLFPIFSVSLSVSVSVSVSFSFYLGFSDYAWLGEDVRLLCIQIF